MKKVTPEVARDRLLQTLISIYEDQAKGKLKVGEEVHEFHRIRSSNPGPGQDLSNEDLASLLEARLRAQGHVMLFDEALARETLDRAMSRLGRLLPRQT